jgi:uncharacterized protein
LLQAAPWLCDGGRSPVVLQKKADEEAIRVFAENLRELLLASPLGQKIVLALDPGFRTGCKLAVLDARANFSLMKSFTQRKVPATAQRLRRFSSPL